MITKTFISSTSATAGKTTRSVGLPFMVRVAYKIEDGKSSLVSDTPAPTDQADKKVKLSDLIERARKEHAEGKSEEYPV